MSSRRSMCRSSATVIEPILGVEVGSCACQALGSDTISTWGPTAEIAIREQLRRILDSDVFVRSERQRRFLSYIVEAALEGSEQRLNQFAIGVEVFDRDESFDPATDSVVRVEAGRLRSKLTDYYAHPGKDDRVLIELPKGGYAPLIELSPPLSAGESDTTIVSKTGLHRPAMLVFAMVSMAGLWLAGSFLASHISPEDHSAESAMDAHPRSAIAVLAFDNMSADAEQEYFSDGISEDIITDLSVISGLKVIARHSSFAYKDQRVGIREIGEDLGVQYVLEGSVRRHADRLRITAQLIDVASEAHVWAERYDRKAADVFDIQDEVVQQIVRALEIAVTDREERRLTHQNTSSVRAHDLYLKGQDRFYEFDRASVLEAIDLFGQAIEIDPGFAESYAWQARALTFAFIAGNLSAKEQTVDRAIVLARRAIEIDDGLAMAYGNLAWALHWDRQIDAATDTVSKAIDRDPSFADAWLWQSLILSTAKDGTESLAAIRRGFELNPRYGVTYVYALGRAYLALGDTETALKQFERTVERNADFLPGRLYEIFTLLRLDRKTEAQEALARLRSSHPRYEHSASYRYYQSEWGCSRLFSESGC